MYADPCQVSMQATVLSCKVFGHGCIQDAENDGCIQDAENERVPTQGLARRFGCHKVEMFYLRILEMLQSLR